MEPRGEVLIVGAGIGGLTLAQGLLLHGIPFQIFERAAAFHPVGAGITVQSNAMRALKTLALDSAVAGAGSVPDAAAILDWQGRVLSRVSLKALAHRVGAPIVTLHRARLHEVLLRGIPKDRLHLGAHVVGVSQTATEVELRLQGRPSVQGCLLVGADGLHSRVRSVFWGEEAPLYSGYTSWRGVCSAEALQQPQLTSESWGRGKRFGIVPVGHGEVYWFATANEPPGGSDPEGARQAVMSRFASWHAPIPALVEATDEGRIIRTDISDRRPMRTWSQGRVTLLGDAAHPMTPNLGQGGCQAIEDAVALASELSKTFLDPVSTWARYEETRLQRAHSVARASRRLGRLAQASNPVLVFARDWAVRLTPERIATAQMAKQLR